MGKRNLTLQLDEETLQKAKVLAARRALSVSRLVAEEIERLVEADDAYSSAWERARASLEAGFDLGGGGRAVDRGSLHER